MKEIQIPHLLTVFFSGATVYYGWLTYHYWENSIDYQKYYYDKSYVIITFLQEMGIISSIMTFVSFTLLCMLLYRIFDVRLTWGVNE